MSRLPGPPFFYSTMAFIKATIISHLGFPNRLPTALPAPSKPFSNTRLPRVLGSSVLHLDKPVSLGSVITGHLSDLSFSFNEVFLLNPRDKIVP